MTTSPRPVLSTHQLYVVPFRGQDFAYRFLADDGTDYHFMEVGAFIGKDFKRHAPPDAKKERRVRWTLRKVRELKEEGYLDLDHRVEARLPPRLIRATIQRGQNPKLDEAREVLALIFPQPAPTPKTPGAEITDEDRRGARLHYEEKIYPQQLHTLVTDDKAYKQAITAAHKEFPHIPRKTIRAWVAKHIFYEAHENSCLSHDWLKGGKDKPRADIRSVSGTLRARGRPTKHEKANKNSKIKRRPISKYHLRRWFSFLRDVGAKSMATMKTLVADFKALGVAHNTPSGKKIPEETDASKINANRKKSGKKDRSEERIGFRINPKYLGTDDYLAKRGRVPLSRARAAYREKHRWDVAQRMTSGGSAQDLVDGDLSVLDLDATLPKNFIVLEGEEGTRKLNGNAQPLVFLAVDRRTTAIVGWYVCFGHENGRAYASLLYSAFTDKEDELARWKVSGLEGMVFGFTNTIFVDRGPGISEAVQRKACELLRLMSLYAEPGRGEAKGHVENRNGLMQRDLMHLPGSGLETKSKVENHRRNRDIRRGTGVTIEVYMQKLLGWISKRNLTVNKKIWLTEEMRIAGVPQTPKAVYEFLKKTPSGDRSLPWSREELYKKLSTVWDRTTRDGYIQMPGGRKFFSPELAKEAEEYFADHRESMPVKVLEVPSQPLELSWERESDGRLMPLKPTATTAEAFANTYSWVHEKLEELTDLDNKLNAMKEEQKQVKEHNRKVQTGMISLKTQSEMQKSDAKSTMYSSTGQKRRALRKSANVKQGEVDAQHHRDMFDKDRGGTSDTQGRTQAFVHDDDDISVVDDQQDF